MKKFVLCLSFLSALFICTLTNNIHAEEGMSIEDVVISETNKPVTFSYDLNQRLADVKIRLDNIILQNYNISPDKYSPAYIEILNKISLNPALLNTTEEERQAFSALSTLYIGRITSSIYEDMSDDEKRITDEAENNLLNNTFLEIRNDNIKNLKLLMNQKNTLEEREVFLIFMNHLLQNMLYDGNGAYKFIYGKDCTNFASQIMQAGGMIQSYTSNSSGYKWYYANAFAHSKSWTWAHGFMQYWTAEGARTASFTSTSSAIPHIRKGNFIGYWDKTLFEFSHMAYVNNVSNGKVYICQHTINRKNALWNNIDWKSDYRSITILSVG